MDAAVTFRRHLKVLRQLSGLSQEELSTKAGRSVEAISNLERGLNLPSFEMLEQLATALNVPVRAFFEDEVGGDTADLKLGKFIRLARQLSDHDLDIAIQQVAVLVNAARRYERGTSAALGGER